MTAQQLKTKNDRYAMANGVIYAAVESLDGCSKCAGNKNTSLCCMSNDSISSPTLPSCIYFSDKGDFLVWKAIG